MPPVIVTGLGPVMPTTCTGIDMNVWPVAALLMALSVMGPGFTFVGGSGGATPVVTVNVAVTPPTLTVAIADAPLIGEASTRS